MADAREGRQMPGLQPYLPTVRWVRALIAPALVFIVAGMDRGYQTDFWHHLARGRELALVGRADRDNFTCTIEGTPLRDANWLTQLFYYRLFSIGGLEGVQLANALALAAALALLVE